MGSTEKDSTSHEEEEEEELISAEDAPSVVQPIRTADAAGVSAAVSAAGAAAGVPHVPQVLVQFCVS